MSIINKVLQEIEKNRPEKPATMANAKLELGTNFNKYKQKIFHRFTFIILAIIILAAVLFMLYQSTNKLKPAATLSLPQHKHAPASVDKTGSDALAQKPKTPTHPVATAKLNAANLTKLDNITVNLEHDKTIINFILSRDTYYYVEHSHNPLQLKLILGNTTYDTEFPLNFARTAVKTLNLHKEHNNTILDLELAPETQIIGLQLYNQPQTQLQLVLLNTAIPTGTLNKIAIPLTSKQRAEQNYQDALDLLGQNKNDLAVAKLYEAVKVQQEEPQVFELLATLLIKSEKFNEAIRTLDNAIKVFPNDARLTQLKAYALAQKGQIKRAISLLLNNPPEVADDPDYYAFIANLYQQQGEFMLAAQLYNNLLKLQPNRATWWMGLGIALENADKTNAAAEAYRKAAAVGNLPPEAEAFVNSKIQ